MSKETRPTQEPRGTRESDVQGRRPETVRQERAKGGEQMNLEGGYFVSVEAPVKIVEDGAQWCAWSEQLPILVYSDSESEAMEDFGKALTLLFNMQNRRGIHVPEYLDDRDVRYRLIPRQSMNRTVTREVYVGAG